MKCRASAWPWCFLKESGVAGVGRRMHFRWQGLMQPWSKEAEVCCEHRCDTPALAGDTGRNVKYRSVRLDVHTSFNITSATCTFIPWSARASEAQPTQHRTEDCQSALRLQSFTPSIKSGSSPALTMSAACAVHCLPAGVLHTQVSKRLARRRPPLPLLRRPAAGAARCRRSPSVRALQRSPAGTDMQQRTQR